MFEWYDPNRRRAVYGQAIQYWDDFEGADGSDPTWPKDGQHWNESGGNIFIHAVPDDMSHVHMDYSNPGGYLLMRRDKADGYTGSPIVLEFGFGEDMANPAGRFFGVWGNGTQMALGVHTGQWANDYFYRVSNSTTLIDSQRPRTADWHIFRFYIRYESEGCSYGEINGVSLLDLGKNCSITPTTTDLTWGIASAWSLTDPPNLDGIWDNAVYFHH